MIPNWWHHVVARKARPGWAWQCSCRPTVERLEDRCLLSLSCPATTYDAGINPGFATVGDFDGDGNLDLVVPNNGAHSVRVLLGKGDGTFKPMQSFPVQGNNTTVAVGDFIGNGIQDLAVTNTQDDTVSILLGNGDGTFQSAVNYYAGPGPRAIQAADFNGDGIPDLVVANERSNTVSVLLGRGDGTFRPPIAFRTDANNPDAEPFSLAVGDFNQDGKPDIAVANRSYDNGKGNIGVLLNSSTGDGFVDFQPVVNYATPDPISIVAADFINRGDGHLDLVAANWLTNTLHLMKGLDDGTFVSNGDIIETGNPFGLVAADFSHDGWMDLAVSRWNANQVVVYLNHQNPTQLDFVTPPAFACGTGTKPVASVAANFNNAGGPDLVVSNNNNGNSNPSTVSVYLNDQDWPPKPLKESGSDGQGGFSDLPAIAPAVDLPRPTANVRLPAVTLGADGSVGGSKDTADTQPEIRAEPLLPVVMDRAAPSQSLTPNRLDPETRPDHGFGDSFFFLVEPAPL